MDWPPAFLLDVIYGITVFRKYGHVRIADQFGYSRYYPEGIKTFNDRATAVMKKKQEARQKKANEQKTEHEQRYQRRYGMSDSNADTDSDADPYDIVLALWQITANSEAMKKATAERTAKLSQQHKEELARKVELWKQSCT